MTFPQTMRDAIEGIAVGETLGFGKHLTVSHWRSHRLNPVWTIYDDGVWVRDCWKLDNTLAYVFRFVDLNGHDRREPLPPRVYNRRGIETYCRRTQKL